MELTAGGTPFLYFPPKNHFEQNFHVTYRLDQYNTGRKMIYEQSDTDRIAQAKVEELAHPKVFNPFNQMARPRRRRCCPNYLRAVKSRIFDGFLTKGENQKRVNFDCNVIHLTGRKP
ncbi:MAG: hypothetical protein JKY94_06305 [Rhodobacteraceae bacterium]|nr:hypothetical protein [Paracoccaceae bacterium]